MKAVVDQIDLLKSSYHYELPEELIAQRPTQKRDECLLLAYDHGNDALSHEKFHDLLEILPKNTTLVLNESKVIPSRLLLKKASGGKVEVFVLDLMPIDGVVNCLIRSNKAKKLGEKYYLSSDDPENSNPVAEIVEASPEGFKLKFFTDDLETFLNLHGLLPIPPYIRGGLSDEEDREDYQTVFAEKKGSVAAPTAGLHFTESMLEALKEKGIEIIRICLHVGLGTFAPVKSDDLSSHKMHTEIFELSKENFEKIKSATNLVAVGTTSLRVIETLNREEFNDSWKLNGDMIFGETDIFLNTSNPVQHVHGLITNFHLPESTLLMLVASMVGREKILDIYKEAVKKRYRFFSYGDAMFLTGLEN
ncbi:MAG: tRNA preQ1(34) S-adenosylmethionine ribosyltransferase-isomerase QueA [Bacteriovoracaceae bacterium]